jgi:hypothetical protein
MITLNRLLSAPPYTDITALLQKKTSPLNIDPARIANFLQARQLRGDLPEAKLFIENLERLETLVNPDRKRGIGVERIFENAEERVSKKENPSGHYFEARLGIAFVNAGFKIKEISAKKSLEQRDENMPAYIQRREFDFVVVKDGIKYYVEATKHIGRVIEADEKNQKTEFLVKIANKYGAVPVRVLDSFSNKDKRQIAKHLENFPELRIWRVPEDSNQTIEDLDIISASA